VVVWLYEEFRRSDKMWDRGQDFPHGPRLKTSLTKTDEDDTTTGACACLNLSTLGVMLQRYYYYSSILPTALLTFNPFGPLLHRQVVLRFRFTHFTGFVYWQSLSNKAKVGQTTSLRGDKAGTVTCVNIASNCQLFPREQICLQVRWVNKTAISLAK